MTRTPDEFPGERIDSSILLESGSLIPSKNGEFSYVSGTGFRFMDEGILKGLSGLSITEHEYLNSLAHDPSISSFDDILYGSYGILTMSIWTDSSRSQILQYYSASYNTNRLISVLTSSAYLSGVLNAQVIEVPTYDSRKRIVNITRTRVL